MIGVRQVDGRAEAVEVAEPEPAGGEVVVEVTHVGICGSDLHLVERRVTHTLGHEIAGTLDGQAVVVEPVAHCGRCDPCRAGRTSLCRVGTADVVGVHRDGGMAEAVVVDASAVHDVPPGLAPAVACLVEPAAVALHGVHRAEIEPGQRVVVVGAGAIGLCVGVLAQMAGAEVEVVVRHPHQGAAAERLGLATAPRRGADVVVEAAGTGSALASAVSWCRPGARLAVVGTYWDPVELPGLALQLKEIDLVPSVYYGHHHGRHEFSEAAEALARRPELADVLITHRLPLAEAGRGFEIAADRAAGATKVILEPG